MTGKISSAETLMTQADAAFAGGEYATAAELYTRAKGLYASRAVASRSDPGGGSDSMSFAHIQQLDSVIRECRRLANKSRLDGAAMRLTPVQYVRESDDTDYE
jgi:hypothetical protein